MKKKLIAAIAMLCLAAFALAACGSSGGTNTSGSGAASGGGASGGGAAETYDVGAFTVAVPAGWTVFPQSDIFGEQDADGNYPIDPEQIFLAKGVTDEFDAYSAPSVRIYYYGPDSYVMDSRGFYDNVADITGVTVNGNACDAYQGESMGYLYQFISEKTDDAQFEFNILKAVEGKDTGITWEDPDVKTIMESVKAK